MKYGIYVEENGKFVRKELNAYEYGCYSFSEEEMKKWLNEVQIKDLIKCLDCVSNDALVDYKYKHRERELNILEGILQESLNSLSPSHTYGTRPNAVCQYCIGYITDRKYRLFDITSILIEIKQSEMKQWLLDNHKFSDREKRLLHYFKGE